MTAASSLSWEDQAGPTAPFVESYLQQSHASIDLLNHPNLSIGDIARYLSEFWNWSNIRSKGSQLIRVRHVQPEKSGQDPISLLEVVGTDRPFLVGSILGACRELNIQTGMLLHPILEHDRTVDGRRTVSNGEQNESYIQVYLEHLDGATSDRLEAEVRRTLNEVRLSVQDFTEMQERMLAAAETVAGLSHLDPGIAEEASEFLKWLAYNHFTFLGSRYYNFVQRDDGSLAAEEPEIIPDSSLGILRDLDRFILQRGSEPTIITSQISDFLNEPTPIIVAKASLQSRVHRRVRADYIGVKTYDDNGQVTGEIRFAGLFTADAYNALTRDVPLIRQKVTQVLEAAGKRPGSHDANALKNILETYPRDELFQISPDDLLSISTSILQLQERAETRIFLRRDQFDRYLTALVYVPRESFNSELRARIAKRLEQAFSASLIAFYPSFSDSPLARIHFIFDLKPGHPEPNIKELEHEIARLARSWNDEVRGLVRTQKLSLPSELEEDQITSAFNLAYKEAFSPEQALQDLSLLLDLTEDRPVSMRASRGEHDPLSVIRARIYAYAEPIQLSACVPVFENMGLYVVSEVGYPVKSSPDDDQPRWVHTLSMRSADQSPIDLARTKVALEDAFEAVWTHKTENDGFNRLVLSMGATWREAALFRTLSRYRKQTGLDPAQGTQIAALARNPEITQLLLHCFSTRFDPDRDMSLEERKSACSDISHAITEALNAVESLDEDRVLRRLSELIHAITRTSFYQINENGEPHSQIAIKIASRELEALPEPRPFREIFVWSPHVEGVHLRFGPVARGGLRWSDRRDDFRTEVLGLVKAQQVKNAVIVPVGSKGGFYPKQLPIDGDREAIRDEGIRSYKTFITSLLMLTDNLVDGEPKHPKRTVIWDQPDPYLVVAADKGTATFSDIANEISESFGFWLGDAFASGGSAGYDHKKMGITARGAWVAVQRHFREIGKDIQTERFSVIGVGDMSGDVFGNGMLLSHTIDLKAAFNHLHIFIDPNPSDPEANWQERKRIFDLPRSSWSDYNTDLISQGGGVFSRNAKRIELTPEIQAFLKTDSDAMTPSELIQAILKAEAELLWFGGIGTYVKSAQETDLQVGDKSNDAVRISAGDLKVEVVGEGANLGVTQAGRIEFARLGGRINTDAIDNSAGVDSSDHEVNIKILLKAAMECGELNPDQRLSLLASMTDEVGEKVLVHNYDQTGALSVAEASAADDLDSHERMMERLEAAGILNRSVEGLPKSEEIRAFHEAHTGLTRPEIAVLLAYAKITLFDELVQSNVPDDPFLTELYSEYFPEPLRGFSNALGQHRLKREIIATQLSNDIINLGGPTFIHRVKERAGVEAASIARAFVASKEIFALAPLLRKIDGLDNQVPADIQIGLHRDIINALRRQVFWLAKTRSIDGRIDDLVSLYKPDVQRLLTSGADTLSPYESDLFEKQCAEYREQGAPSSVAESVAIILSMTSATDIVDLARRTGQDVIKIACLFSSVGSVFRFDELRQTALNMTLDQHWDRLAVRGLVETLLVQQNSLAERISANNGNSDLNNFAEAKVFVDEFVTQHEDEYKRLQLLLAELEQSGAWTFSKLVLFANAMRSFIDETDLGAT
tara:strand:+ start:35166 stop:39995 length:4830 start_codon:yes stop_codon:yes gene_type:complete